MWMIRRTCDWTYFVGSDQDGMWVFSHQSFDAIQYTDSNKILIKLYPGEMWEEVSNWVIRLKGTDTYYTNADGYSYGALSGAVRFSDTEKATTLLDDVEMWEEVSDVGH